MEKTRNALMLVGMGIVIGVILTVTLVLVVGAKPKGLSVGGVDFEVPTTMATATTSTIIPTSIFTRVPSVPTPTATRRPQPCADVNGTELLSAKWRLEGDNGDAQAYQKIEPKVLQGKDTLMITYDLHGLSAIEGEKKDASAIVLDQPNWHVASLAKYGENGKEGEQIVLIPLSDFIGIPDAQAGIAGGAQLDLNKPVGTLHTRFWYNKHFVVDITSICAFKLQP